MKFSSSLLPRTSVLAAGLVLGTALMGDGAASAAPLPPPSPNLSFEDNIVSDGNTVVSINGWNITGSAFTNNPNNTTYSNSTGSSTPTGGDSAQSALLTGVSSIESVDFQATMVANTNYRFTIAIGRELGSGLDAGSLQVGFLLGSSNTLRAANIAAPAAIAPTRGTFSDYSFNYVATSTDAGQSLRLYLGQTSAGRVGFDNARLTTSVVATPEPSTWAMIALGVGAIGLVGRKRKRDSV